MRTRPSPLRPTDISAARAQLEPAVQAQQPGLQEPALKAGHRAKAVKPAFDAKTRAAALEQLEALAERYGEVSALDVEAQARQMSAAAGKSLRGLHSALEDLKAQGALVRPETAEAMSPELLTRLQQGGLPARVQRHVLGLASRDLVAMLAHPSKNRGLLKALGKHAGRYGVLAQVFKAALPPPDMPLKDRNARQTTALLALLVDNKLPKDLRLACIEQLGRVGDVRAAAKLSTLAARAKDLDVRAAAQTALTKVKSSEKMTIVFATMEARPYAGTGGLGNVMKELPRALAKMGHRVIVVTPRHTIIDRDTLDQTKISGHIDSPVASEPFGVLHDHADGVDHYFVENDKYFSADRNGIYGDEHGGYGDEAERYDFFSAAVPQVIKKVLGKQAPDIVQLNDAHTGPAAAYLKSDPYFGESKTVMAVHNLGAAYQGRFGGEAAQRMMFKDMNLMSAGGPAEFFGDVSLMKLGLTKSDAAITVSRAYKDEILTEAQGEGMHGVLRGLDAQDKLYGNLNGIDTKAWDPQTDPLLPTPYSFHDLDGKLACKAALQESFGLPVKPEVPVVGVVARLAEQKGWGDVIKAIEHAAETGKKVQFVLCGQGDKKIAAQLQDLAERYPEMVAFDEAFSGKKEHSIYGGSDLFLMPSLFEPCGLPQMYALRYLTVPIVRAVGGLDESIQAYDPKRGEGNGFKFDEDVRTALDQALTWYESGPDAQRGLLRSCALSDFSWQTRSAVEQVAVYREVINA